MSKPVKEMMMADYLAKLGENSDALLLNILGVDANSTNELRKDLAKSEISVTVLRNNVARKAFEGSGLEPLADLLTGPNALVYGAETVVEVARKIVDIAEDLPDMELRGAVLDGELFEGEDGVKRLSKFPTRDEAIAKVVTVVLTPGGNLVGAAKSPASNLAGILKTIQDKLEAGETIAKIADARGLKSLSGSFRTAERCRQVACLTGCGLDLVCDFKVRNRNEAIDGKKLCVADDQRIGAGVSSKKVLDDDHATIGKNHLQIAINPDERNIVVENLPEIHKLPGIPEHDDALLRRGTFERQRSGCSRS